jgi:hypothetical protein
MKIGHIYATPNGESHIGELDLTVVQNENRPSFYNSARLPAIAIGFQNVRAGGATDWHTTPQRWLALVLAGNWEIEVSDGSRIQYPAGSVSLVEDTMGKGHRGRAVGNTDVIVASVRLTDDAVIS